MDIDFAVSDAVLVQIGFRFGAPRATGFNIKKGTGCGHAWKIRAGRDLSRGKYVAPGSASPVTAALIESMPGNRQDLKISYKDAPRILIEPGAGKLTREIAAASPSF